MGLRGGLFALLALVAATAPAQQDTRRVTAAEYDRSALFLPWNKSRLILDDEVNAVWIGDSGLVSYRTSDEDGWRFMIADPARDVRRPAFDHVRIAVALTAASGARIDPRRIPASRIDWPRGPDGPVQLAVGDRLWECATACVAVPAPAPRDPTRSWSPDGRVAIAFNGFDLLAIDAASGTERRLTTDGTRDQPYAGIAGIAGPVSRQMMGIPVAPIGEFSPDGRWFLTYRLDERRTPERTLIRNAPPGEGTQPRVVTFRAAWTGDPPTVAQLLLIEVATGRVVSIAHPPTRAALQAPVALGEVRWTADSRQFYFTDYADRFRERALFRGDAATGRVERLIVERAATNQYDFLIPPFELLADGGVVWPSDRSGWRQLYRYDRAGRLRNAITHGAFVVREITRVDERAGTITFAAGGLAPGDPYLRHVYRVPLAGGHLTPLTPEDADHTVRIGSPQMQRMGGRAAAPPAFSADGRWFLDVFSRVDRPTETVIRRAVDGQIVSTLATARHSHDVPAFSMPEPFMAMAADGVTPVYGLIVKPADFDPTRRYPVIDSMYAGPQSIYVPKMYGWELVGPYGRGLAELGFVVFMVDGRGLPGRSRANQDASYGRLQTAGFLVDHVAALRQLGATRPWMDLSRVGAFGLSAGGYGVVRAMLDHSDIYKVGVATSPYDPLLNDVTWQERYQGSSAVADVLPAALSAGAERLRGNLLVMQGDLDDIASPSGTLQLADALIRANKDFDMVIVPNTDHQLAVQPYAIRRQWDFFVRHLLGAEPPADYRFKPPARHDRPAVSPRACLRRSRPRPARAARRARHGGADRGGVRGAARAANGRGGDRAGR